jgi:histidinol-phosphate phosphatase family protein
LFNAMPTMPSLFLDRDGVLNTRLPGEYVRHAGEFVPMDGVGEALGLLARHFGRIVVVTNQAGIGKGLMEAGDLTGVHHELRELALAAGGRIDGIYHCPHRSDEGCDCRKPATGLAWQARQDYPDIDFQNSWMVGDSAADMAFGRALGMHTVLIAGKFEEADLLAEMEVNLRFNSLLEFAQYIEEQGGVPSG